MSNKKVVLMTPHLLDSVYAVFKASIPECWSKQEFEKELLNTQACILVAVEDTAVLGFVQLRHIAGEGELLNIAVAPTARHQGIGTMLIEAMCETAKREQIEAYFLEVRAQNETAISFYEALGFQRVGRRNGFYRNPPDDALLYCLETAVFRR